MNAMWFWCLYFLMWGSHYQRTYLITQNRFLIATLFDIYLIHGCSISTIMPHTVGYGGGHFTAGLFQPSEHFRIKSMKYNHFWEGNVTKKNYLRHIQHKLNVLLLIKVKYVSKPSYNLLLHDTSIQRVGI